MQNYKTLRTEENLHKLTFGDDFLDMTLKMWSMKELIDKLVLMNLKPSIICEYRCHENEDTSHRQREIFAKDASDIALLPQIYK